MRDPAKALPTKSPLFAIILLASHFVSFRLLRIRRISRRVLVTGSVLPHFNLPVQIIAGSKDSPSSNNLSKFFLRRF